MSQDDGELEGVILREFLTSAFAEITHVQFGEVWCSFAGIGQNSDGELTVAIIDPEGVIFLEDLTDIEAVHAKSKTVLRGEVQR